MNTLSIAKIKRWLQTRDLRERIFLAFAAAALTYSLWSLLVERSITHEEQTVESKINTTQIENEGIQQEIQNIAEVINKSSYTQTIQQQKNLTTQSQNFKQRLQNLLPTVIASKDLPALTAAILKEGGITFIGLKKLPSENWIPEGLSDPSSVANTKDIFKYNMEIQFSSDYFSALDYLARLEKLPWHLYWDSIDYTVTQYPKANVVIKIYVLTR